MSFNKEKSKKIAYQFVTFFLTFAVGYFSCFEQSIAGCGTPEETYELKDAVAKKLFEQGICSDIDHCVGMSHDGGTKRIYLNLYDQTGTIFTAHVVSFFIEEALRISKGIPVTFSVYPKPHDDYINQGFFSKKDYIIRLEINKEKNHA